MKKFYLILLVAVTGIANSQSIILTSPTTVTTGLITAPNTVVNNDTITYCVADLGTTFEEGRVIVINNTASTMDIKVKRFGNEYSCFTQNQFCWTICYAPATSVSPTGISITAGDSTQNFHGWMTPDGNEGCCFLKYRFYDANDTTVYSDVTIKYCFSSNCADATLGTEEPVKANMLALYPNPASDLLTAEFTPIQNSGMISLTDITGKVVRTIYLGDQANKQLINLESLKDGVYIYTLYNNGKTISTKKLIIRK